MTGTGHIVVHDRAELKPIRKPARGRRSASAWYIFVMDALRQVLAEDPRIEYALVFGSLARGTAHAGSDLDVAVGVKSSTRIGALELGDLLARLERAAGRSVDLVVLDEAPPGLAYRIFRDGRVIVEKNHRALVERKTRAILEYLDFRPIETLAARGVIAAAAHG
jgi:predicted nucleotidyltransferase